MGGLLGLIRRLLWTLQSEKEAGGAVAAASAATHCLWHDVLELNMPIV